MTRTYAFVDEWDVRAPIEAVFDALSDPERYPLWWKPVYLAAKLRDENVVEHLFKGRLPYRLRVTSETVAKERPTRIEAVVRGDLSGRGIWTLSRQGDSAHVRFDWQVDADRPFLRVLTPVLGRLFRWNHNWAIKRAMEGLEPYARRLAGLPN
jgi:uncharacterized protein YndB with AHSA1/START domain